jgi:FkbM family methyltransferase
MQSTYPSIILNTMRAIGVCWAKTSKAPGWLYQLIEKYSSHFDETKYLRILVNGSKIECDIRDHVQQKIYFFGVYEPLEMYLFNSCIKKDDIVIDAGANVGIYTLNLLSSVGPNGQVHSFEPVPENFKSLSKNLNLSENPKQVILNNNALWNKEETLEFKLAPEHSNNVGSFTTGNVEGALRSFKCSAITLDSYVKNKNLSKVNAIKMDIEGAEKFALQGGLETIKKFRPIVCMEINRSACTKMGYPAEDLIAPFKDLNYKIFFISGNLKNSGWVQDISSITQGNILLIPNEIENVPDLKASEKEIRKNYLRYK